MRAQRKFWYPLAAPTREAVDYRENSQSVFVKTSKILVVSRIEVAIRVFLGVPWFDRLTGVAMLNQPGRLSFPEHGRR